MPTSPPLRSRRPLYGLLASTGMSVTGNAVVGVLIPWLVLRETHNAAYAGLVNSAALGAAVVALFFGAAIIDRWDRRTLSVGADILSALAVFAIPLVDALFGLSITMIVVLVVIGALFDAPGRSAREAMRPKIAEQSGFTLERTNALGEVTDSIGFIAGPAGAGVAVAAIGLSSSFWLAGGFLFLAGIVFWLSVGPSQPDRSDDEDDESVFATAIGGFKIVWADQVLRDTAISASMFGLVLAPIVLVFTTHFEATGRSAALGGLLAAFSIGSVVGALVYAAVGERLPRRATMLFGSFTASIGLGAMGIALDNFTATVIIAIVTGVLAGPLNPIFSVIIQQRTTDAIRGRTLTTLGTVELMTAPASMALTGVLIEATSPATAMYAIGGGALLATSYSAVAPGLRRLEAKDLSPIDQSA